MGLHEYLVSQKIEREDYPFYSLVMALARKADTDNLEKLKVAFPKTVKELERRYYAGAGILPEDLTRRARYLSGTRYIEGRMGTFGPPIQGTFWMPDGATRAVAIGGPERLEIFENGEWKPNIPAQSEKED